MPRGEHDIPMSGTHLKGTHEVVTKGVDPTIGFSSNKMYKIYGHQSIRKMGMLSTKIRMLL